MYGTSLAPEVGIWDIAWNNYDGIINVNKGMLRKAEWGIKVTLPASTVKEVKDPKNSKRDILMHDGVIDLNEYPYEVIRVPELVK